MVSDMVAVDPRDDFAGTLSRIDLRRADSGGGRLVAESLKSLAAEHGIPLERLEAIWDELLQTCIDEALGVSPSASTRPGEQGEWFTGEGHSLSDSLQVVQELRHTAIEALRREAADEGRDEAFVITGMNRVTASMNNFMLEFSTGYFAAEVSHRSRQRAQQDSVVWNVLSGTAKEGDAFTRLGAYGLDGTLAYWAFRTRPATDADHAELETYLRVVGDGPERCGMATVIDGDVCGFVAELPETPSPGLIGVSGPVSFGELPAAFRRATRAFRVARLAGLGGVHSLEDLGIVASVMTDGDIADVLTETYLQPLRELDDYGETLLHTVHRYVANDCQIDLTARELVLHANTVRYRLAKFEEILGISLRDTKSLAEVWWALELPDELTRPRARSSVV